MASKPDESAIIASEAEECLHGVDRPWQRSVKHCVNLLYVHGHGVRRDHVAYVSHRSLTEETLGAHDEELILLQLGEHKVDMAEMLQPR
jgi:hypothetical protein